MSRMVKLCHLDDMPEQSARGFDPSRVGQDTVFVVRQGNDVYAYKDLCPHYGDTALPWRKDEYLDPWGETIVCAAHGAHFEIATGLCIDGPCMGECLPKVPVQIMDNGDILAAIDQSHGGGESP